MGTTNYIQSEIFYKKSIIINPCIKANITYLAPKYKRPPILKNISRTYVFKPGEITWLLGPSGAGKTTLLRLLGGDKTVEFRGKINYYYNGQSHYKGEVFSDGKIGLFLPEGGLPPWQKVIKILHLPANLNKKLKNPSDDKINQTLDTLRLPRETKDKLTFELSLGMKYRILIALAFLYEPSFYLIDELFSALDQPTADFLIEELNKKITTSNSVCVITTHNIDRALSIPGSYYYKDLGQNLIPLDSPTKSDIYECFKSDKHKIIV